MSLQYQSENDEQLEPAPGDAVAKPRAAFAQYTFVLIASYALVAAVQFATGLDRSVALAGFIKPAFIHDHEYWRILTGAALHGGILHLLMNSYAFYNLGNILEMLTDRANVAIVFLLSAIGGGAMSVLFQPDGTSVGASGGIIGLIGYLVVYAFRRHEFISKEFRRSLLINIAIIIAYGLLLYQFIDNFAHAGGLLTGAVYGFFQIPSDSYTDPREAGPIVKTFGLVSLGVYIAVCGFTLLLLLGVA